MRCLPLLVVLVAPLVALASCAPIPAPAPPAPLPAAPLPPPPAPAPLAADWRDWPITPGDWVYRQDARGSIALFGQPGLDAELTLRCDRTARQIYLARRGTASAAPITVRTSSSLRALPAAPTGDGHLAAALAPNDALLDAIGYSRGRFVVQQEGLPTLVVPAWAEILRVTEDCRS